MCVCHAYKIKTNIFLFLLYFSPLSYYFLLICHPYWIQTMGLREYGHVHATSTIANLWPHIHTCQSETSTIKSVCCANLRSTCKERKISTCRQVALAKTTPINQLINHNWLICIFATYSKSSFIYANVQQKMSSRERGRGQDWTWTCWLLRDQIRALFRFMQILTVMIYSRHGALGCQRRH